MEAVDAAPPARPGKANADLVTFIQMVAFGVVGFGIIILTARSIFTALNKPVTGLALAGGAPGQISGGLRDRLVQSPPVVRWGGVLGIGHSPGEGAHPEGDDDESLTLSNIQGQMRASSVRKVVSLVDQHPDTTLGIIRGWISADSA
jgi:flagellar M-ring protein FliF